MVSRESPAVRSAKIYGQAHVCGNAVMIGNDWVVAVIRSGAMITSRMMKNCPRKT